MSFEVVKSVQSDHVRLTVRGAYSFERLYGFIELIRSTAESEGIRKVLVDCRDLSGAMTEADRFRGGQRIAEVLGSEISTAVVMPHGQVTKLGEMAARNRGAALLVTECLDEARAWLDEN